METILFRFNTRQLGEKVRSVLQTHPLLARSAMDAVGGFLNGEVKDLTPQDDGFLTADVSNRTVDYKNSFAAVIFIPSNAPSAQYAVEMHEGNYNLGKNSIAKQHRIGKPVGRRYISRAIEGNRQKIMKIIERRLKSQ